MKSDNSFRPGPGQGGISRLVGAAASAKLWEKTIIIRLFLLKGLCHGKAGARFESSGHKPVQVTQ